jgi:hypothetical protein
MSPKDFVNFLNGAVELGELTVLNDKNFKIVNEKVSTVKADTTQEGEFCNWLKGFLDAIEDKSLAEKQFSKVVGKLFDLNTQKTTGLNPTNDFKIPFSKLPNSDNKPRC